MRCSILLSCLMLTAVAAAACEPSHAEKKNEPVIIELKTSVVEFDPAAPAGTFTCFVHNNSRQDITLPAKYEGHHVRLLGLGTREGGRGYRWPLTLRNRLAVVDLSEQVLKPGRKTKLFEFSLAEILADPTRRPVDAASKGLELNSASQPPANPTTVRPRSRWGWDWLARPAPPHSPIQDRDAYVDSAEFWVEVRVGERQFRSERLMLKVKPEPDAATQVTVPEVSGLSRADADNRIRSAGLTPYLLDGSTSRDEKKIGTVIEQQPTAGTKVRPRSWVTVYVYGVER